MKGHHRNRFALRSTFSGDGIVLVDEDQRSSNASNSMVAFIRSDFTTGWLHGRIQRAFFSSTTTGSISTQEEDHSPKGDHINIIGTLTRKKVNNNTELVGYSGFSSANYLRDQSMTAASNGDFAVSFWIKPNTLDAGSGNYFHLFSIGDSSTGGQGRNTGFVVKMTTASSINANGYIPYFYNNSVNDPGTYDTNNYFPLKTWSHCIMMRRSGRAYVYINGRQVKVGNSWTTNLTDTDCTIGRGFGYNEFGGDAEVALLRYEVGSAPRDDQAMAMYEDEKHLFKENAKCTLYGSSIDIKDCCYDDATDTLHVGTPSGRSDFRGLERINNTIVPVNSTISAHDGFIVEY